MTLHDKLLSLHPPTRLSTFPPSLTPSLTPAVLIGVLDHMRIRPITHPIKNKLLVEDQELVDDDARREGIRGKRRHIQDPGKYTMQLFV